jgi:hypothetical protein
VIDGSLLLKTVSNLNVLLRCRQRFKHEYKLKLGSGGCKCDMFCIIIRFDLPERLVLRYTHVLLVFVWVLLESTLSVGEKVIFFWGGGDESTYAIIPFT